MQEKSKINFEDSNEGTIGARIKVLLSKTKKSVTELEGAGGIGNGTLKSWKDKSIEFSSNVVSSFKQNLQINPSWWETGKGDIFLTPVLESTDSKEKLKSADEIYRDLVESNTEYRLVPKTILNEEYRIVLKSELDEKAEMWKETLRSKNALINQLEREILDLRASKSVAVHAKEAQ